MIHGSIQKSARRAAHILLWLAGASYSSHHDVSGDYPKLSAIFSGDPRKAVLVSQLVLDVL
jgi:hypothetical protein